MPKEKQLVPELRFPEFDGEWSVSKFNDILKFIKSGNSKKSENGNYNLYGSTGIIGKTKDSLAKGKYLLIARVGANAGQINLVKGKFGVSDNTLMLSFSDNVIIEFIEGFLKNFNLSRLVFGSGQPLVTGGLLKKIKIYLPSEIEQQKIADFLTSVDTHIQTLEKKKAALELYKKGVTQKIFKQEIRFKDDDGKEFPDWEKCKLSRLCDRVTQKNKINNQNVLTISAQMGLVNQLEYFNRSVSSKNLKGYYLLKKNDFAYNKSYSNGYPMGAIKRLKYYEKGVVSTLYICFRFKETVSFEFMEQYFDSGLQNKGIKKVAQEGARNHGLLNIGVNDFFDIRLSLPSIEEQAKIAEFLSAIDKQILGVTQQIEHTKAYKKGLLQQMFV